jgi:hypothetical protein
VIGVRLSENMKSEDIRNCLGAENKNAPNILHNTQLKKKTHLRRKLQGMKTCYFKQNFGNIKLIIIITTENITF